VTLVGTLIGRRARKAKRQQHPPLREGEDARKPRIIDLAAETSRRALVTSPTRKWRVR